MIGLPKKNHKIENNSQAASPTEDCKRVARSAKLQQSTPANKDTHDDGLSKVCGDFDENGNLDPEILRRLCTDLIELREGQGNPSREGERKDEEPKSEQDWTSTKLLEKYENLRNITLQNLPNLWPGLEFALSVKTILNIKDCTLPFPGIILGPASSLKTVIIELFRGYKHTFYTDNFSPNHLFRTILQ